MYKLCIFAGTSEGRRLIERLTGRGLSMTACVATEYGEVVLGEHPDTEILSGRMPRDEIAALLRREGFDVVVDATHPYADHVTESIRSACEETATDYLRLLRESEAGEEDGVFVEDTDACVRFLEGTEGNILLTTGSKTLPVFCAGKGLRERICARVLPMASSLQICADCGVAPDHIIAMQGPFDEEMNVAMLRAKNIAWMVTKDTGAAGGYLSKIRAARRAGAKAVIIGRPPQEPGLSPEETAKALEERFALPPKKKRVVLCGIGMGTPDTRTLGMDRAVREAECVIGAKRMVESADTAGKAVRAAIAARDIAEIIRNEPFDRFAVLFSGDTGFYSGAKSLLELLPEAEVELLPGIGSLSYFCSRLRRPWEDVRAVSLHGRECDFVREVRHHAAVFTLLGGADGANEALRRLTEAGLGHVLVHIGERLGYPEERIAHGTAEELLGGSYDPLSVLLAENDAWGTGSTAYGLPDEAFDRDEVPMTKEEVRSISLSKLSLGERSVVWDVGAGSGSVSVECARVAWAGKVYAIEKKESALALTARNVEKYGLRNVEIVPGAAPEALLDLPAPTHVFIGGSSGALRPILDIILEKNPAARIVVNAVTLETASELTELSREFTVADIAHVQVTKPRLVGRYHLMTAQNGVYIFTFQYRKEKE